MRFVAVRFVENAVSEAAVDCPTAFLDKTKRPQAW